MVRYGREVPVQVDGSQSSVWLTALDADEALTTLASRGSDVRLVASRSGERASLPIRLDADGPVNVVADGETKVAPDGSIGIDAILDQQGVSLGELDRVHVEKLDPAAAQDADADKADAKDADADKADAKDADAEKADAKDADAATETAAAETTDPALAEVPLQITDPSKKYKNGDRYSVRDLSFRVEKGQVLGLLGPNGAGKTTTLRMLMGLIQPDGGEIRVFGHAIVPGAPVLSRVGAFVEGAGFLPHLSGQENLELYWRATGRPAARKSSTVSTMQ